MRNIVARIISPPECEELVVECAMDVDGGVWGWMELNHEGGEFSIIMYPLEETKTIEMTLEEFETGVKMLMERAKEVYEGFDSSLIKYKGTSGG